MFAPVEISRVNCVVYLVPCGDDIAMFSQQKEFTGKGAKQRALRYARERAEAGLLNKEFPIEVYRAEFDRNGCLRSQSLIEGYRVQESRYDA